MIPLFRWVGCILQGSKDRLVMLTRAAGFGLLARYRTSGECCRPGRHYDARQCLDKKGREVGSESLTKRGLRRIQGTPVRAAHGGA